MRYLFLLILACTTTISFGQLADVELYDLDSLSKGSARPRMLTTVGGKMFFTARDSKHGQEIWYMDRNNKPHIAADIFPLNPSALFYSDTKPFVKTPLQMGVADGKIYFIGYWLSGTNYRTGLYAMDTGTFAYKVVDTLMSEMCHAVTYKNKLYISAYRGSQKGLIMYDPVGEQTTQLISAEGINMLEEMALVKDNLYFVVNEGTKQTLYEYNITNYTLNVIADSASYGGFTAIHHPIAAGNTLYFVGTTQANGRELYSYSNGSTHMATDLMPGSADGLNDIKPIHHKGLVFFNGNTTRSGYTKTLSAYDTSLKQVITFVNTMGNHTPNAPTLLNPKDFQEYNGRLCFNATAKQNDIELCVFNLDDSTGIKVDAIGGLLLSSKPMMLMPFNGSLYFVGVTEASTSWYSYNELFRYTFFPTATGTVIKHTLKGTAYPNPTTGNATLALQLNTSQTITIMLTDIAGRTIHTIPATPYGIGAHNIVLPLAQQPSGTYFYNIIDNNGATLLSGKMIKH